MDTTRGSSGCRCGWHKLLVVDDYELRRRAAATLLRHRVEVVLAATATEAYALAKSIRPRLALLDFNLASERGPQLIDPLVRLVGDIRVVVYSGQLDDAMADESRAAGAIDAIELEDAHSFDDGLDLLMERPAKTLIERRQVCPALQQIEDEHIERVLWICNGKVNAAAKQLGVSRSKLFQWLKDRGRSTDDFRLVDPVQFMDSRRRRDSR